MGVALTDTTQYSLQTLQSLSAFHQLTDQQQSVLFFVIEDMTSDSNRTDVELAELAGVTPKTIYNCRHNAHFLSCMNEISMLSLKSYIPKAAEALKKKVADGNMKAIDFIYRVTKEYIPTQRNENLNATIKGSQAMATGDVISDFVSMLCNNSGWHIEKIIEEIRKAYDKLKSEGNVV